MLSSLQVGTPDFIAELQQRIMPDVGSFASSEGIGDTSDDSDVVTCLPDGRQLTLPFLNASGFCRPILVESCDIDGLGLTVPDTEFSSDDVPSVVNGGRERLIDVIDVHSQVMYSPIAHSLKSILDKL